MPKKERKLLKAKRLLGGIDSEYKAFTAAKLEKEQEASRKQGQVLPAALNSKFAETIAAVEDLAEPPTGWTFLPAPLPVVGNFTPGQLAQVRELLAGVSPMLAARGSDSVALQGTKTHNFAASGPTTLQKALVSSVFGGRVQVDKDFDLASFKTLVLKSWSRRAVPEAVSAFLQEHAN